MRALIVLAISATGCLPSSEFRCDSDADCGAKGQCELVGYCSFRDPSCPDSKQRYADGAGPYANACVGSDDPPTSCPADFELIPGGTPEHRYRLVSGSESWMAQVTSCSGTETYLAIPSDATELTAIAQLNGNNKSWVGISDRIAEGSFVDVRGAAATFLPWKPGSPETSADNDKDCVVADSPNRIIDDACTAKYAAVCECDD